jgi:hypothetical protein
MNIYALPTPQSTHYLNRYIKFITLVKKSIVYDKYIESHHILPQSMGGLNNDDNLINLSARQHYLAHWMLWKAYKSKEMTSAFFAMSNQNNQYQGRENRITSRTYELLRKEFSQLISDSTTKLWQDPEYRQKHIDTNNTLETKILRHQKGKELWTDPQYVSKVMEGREKARLDGKYQYSTEERARRSTRISDNNNPSKRSDVRAKNSGDNHYSNRSGYIKPSCIHCGMTTTPTNIKRWHNENCKLKD